MQPATKIFEKIQITSFKLTQKIPDFWSLKSSIAVIVKQKDDAGGFMVIDKVFCAFWLIVAS